MGKSAYLCNENQNTMNSISLDNSGISVSVSVYIFKEGDVFIAYCPSLDLSGYDTTEEKAKSDFEFMLDDYLKTQMLNGTLHKDLAKHGWKIGARKLTEPKTAQMLRRNRQLRKVTELPSYHKISVNSSRFAMA